MADSLWEEPKSRCVEEVLRPCWPGEKASQGQCALALVEGTHRLVPPAATTQATAPRGPPDCSSKARPALCCALPRLSSLPSSGQALIFLYCLPSCLQPSQPSPVEGKGFEHAEPHLSILLPEPHYDIVDIPRERASLPVPLLSY